MAEDIFDEALRIGLAGQAMAEEERAWTKGPWFVCPDERNDAWRPGLTIGSVPNGARICDVFALAHEDFGTANARLIAAAPDLYEALSAMDRVIESVWAVAHSRDFTDEETAALRMMRAALAKAEAPHGPPQTDEGLG